MGLLTLGFPYIIPVRTRNLQGARLVLFADLSKIQQVTDRARTASGLDRLAASHPDEPYWDRMVSSYSELVDQAARRLATLGQVCPDLDPAIELQRRLLGEIIALLERLELTRAVTSQAEPAVVAAKLDRGIPALRGQPVELPLSVLSPSLDRFCHYLADGGAGDAARHVLETLESGRMTRASLLATSLARNERAIRMGAAQMGLAPDLVWLIGELATSPFAHLLQRAVFSQRDGDSESAPLRSALAAWHRGYCPACGSWPALAEYVDDARLLRCSFCGSAWELQAHHCIYCREDAVSILTPPDGEPSHARLEVCDRCGGYTKAVRVEAPAPFPLVAIEDMETLSLDRIGVERGYGRPPLPDLGAEATREPPRPCDTDG